MEFVVFQGGGYSTLFCCFLNCHSNHFWLKLVFTLKWREISLFHFKMGWGQFILLLLLMPSCLESNPLVCYFAFFSHHFFWAPILLSLPFSTSPHIRECTKHCPNRFPSLERLLFISFTFPRRHRNSVFAQELLSTADVHFGAHCIRILLPRRKERAPKLPKTPPLSTWICKTLNFHHASEFYSNTEPRCKLFDSWPINKNWNRGILLLASSPIRHGIIPIISYAILLLGEGFFFKILFPGRRQNHFFCILLLSFLPSCFDCAFNHAQAFVTFKGDLGEWGEVVFQNNLGDSIFAFSFGVLSLHILLLSSFVEDLKSIVEGEMLLVRNNFELFEWISISRAFIRFRPKQWRWGWFYCIWGF